MRPRATLATVAVLTIAAFAVTADASALASTNDFSGSTRDRNQSVSAQVDGRTTASVQLSPTPPDGSGSKPSSFPESASMVLLGAGLLSTSFAARRLAKTRG